MTAATSGLAVHEIAKSQGYFRDLHIHPEVLLVADGSKCVAALVSGAAEICIWSGFNQVIPAIARGARLKILAGALNLATLAMYSSRSDVRKVSDLRGRTIGIGATGAVVDQMTVLLLEKGGLTADSVRFRNVGSNDDILKAVMAGTVDAGLGDVDVMGQQQQLGIHVLPDGMLWKEIPEYTNQASYASDAAIRSDRDTLVRLLAVYAKAYRFVSGPDSRDSYLRAWEKVSGSSDPRKPLAEWDWIQQYHPYDLGLVLTDRQIDFVQHANVRFGVQRQLLPIPEIADMSLATAALRRLA
jgi:ABC-type nitrate/sulfonate/bicarbonate transport system substrate-binding protein